MTYMLDLQGEQISVSWSRVATSMLVNWVLVRSKVTHFGALVLTWFWGEYMVNESFRNGINLWVHGLPTLLRVSLGALISFYMWYRNPKRKDIQ